MYRTKYTRKNRTYFCGFHFLLWIKVPLIQHEPFNSLRPSDAYIGVSNLTIISSDNGLSPGRRQAIIWTDAGILLIGPSRTNFSEILIGIQTFSFKKMHLKMSSAKCRPFGLGLNVLRSVVLWLSSAAPTHCQSSHINYQWNINVAIWIVCLPIGGLAITIEHARGALLGMNIASWD